MPTPLGTLPTPAAISTLLGEHADTPISRSDAIRKDVRDLLRHGGYKPSGRGKPASEYLLAAARREAGISHINLLVDTCNVVSLHSGLPISVVDLERAGAPLWIGLAASEARYVFNASGQEIRLGGLLCLGDSDGPTANSVKDAQRTKTCDATQHALTVLWAPKSHQAHAEAAMQWYRELLSLAGATTTPITWVAGTRPETA
ncbi:MAG: hypothetical protein ACPG77_05545 [Nannocystaceae bacterium]